MKPAFLATALCAMLALPSFAQTAAQYQKDAAGAKDHPMLKRVEGSVILKASGKKFDSHRIPLEKILFDYKEQTFRDWRKLTVEGARTTLFYRQPADSSTLECIRSYQQDLREKGFEVLFEGASNGKPTAEANELDDGYGRFVKQVYNTESDYGIQKYTLAASDDFRFTALKKPAEGEQGDVYVTIFCGAATKSWKEPEKGILEGTVLARVDVIETKAMENRMVEVKAEEMQRQIDQTGRVALYGIFFDFNKTDLKPESDPTLREIAGLLAADPDLKLLVVGHTDNVGGFETNRDLSNRRAAAVVEVLVSRHKVSRQRLFPFGCSFASPAAPNASEDGRAKNRRVELVKWD